MEELIYIGKARLTKHAIKRAKERLKWNKSTLQRMADKALTDEGIRHVNTKGRLNKYITRLWQHSREANNIRIYGQTVYLFKGLLLITVFQLPNQFKSTTKSINAKRTKKDKTI